MLSGADFQPAVVQRLLILMKDRVAANRDWATFLLSQSSHNSPTIVAALNRNADEADKDISAEAILGLAKRSRLLARRPMLEKLYCRTLDEKDIEAAGYVGHQSLLRQLHRIQKMSKFKVELMERAICSCKSGKPQNHGFY